MHSVYVHQTGDPNMRTAKAKAHSFHQHGFRQMSSSKVGEGGRGHHNSVTPCVRIVDGFRITLLKDRCSRFALALTLALSASEYRATKSVYRQS